MRHTFISFSFGCRVNEAERQMLDYELLKAGLIQSINKPDICIINTCAVTQKAEREARQLVYRLKRIYPKTKILITGCAATYWKKTKSWQSLPVDLVVGNKEKERLSKRVMDMLKKGTKSSLTKGVPQDKYTRSGRYLIKIQDGCQRFCVYCIVPYLRGLPRSYPIQSVLDRIHVWAKDAKELILTAINTETYGSDTRETLPQLLEMVLQKTDIPRISFGSINPWSITSDFIGVYEKYKNTGRLVRFFHIPLQSGSNTILDLMKRGYTTEEFRKKITMVSALDPFAFIATDVIVGFLGETEKEFEETYHFLKTSPISKFHIFRFSMRNNTAAFHLSKKISEPTSKEKERRAKRLAKLGKKKYGMFLKKHVGHTFSALFLDRMKEHYRLVLLSNQIPAFIKTNKNQKGEIKKVKILEYKKGELFGKIVE